jgi:hypothetical protein
MCDKGAAISLPINFIIFVEIQNKFFILTIGLAVARSARFGGIRYVTSAPQMLLIYPQQTRASQNPRGLGRHIEPPFPRS